MRPALPPVNRPEPREQARPDAGRVLSSAMHELGQIRNFLRMSDRIATSGMPKPEEFAAIRRAGFEVVINLAMPTSDYAMANEGDLVSLQGMTYVHIPVNFETPQRADWEKFSQAMRAFESQRVFVHCAANKRVSAFMFLHRVLHENAPRAEAERDLKLIWEPNAAWQRFIDDQLAAGSDRP